MRQVSLIPIENQEVSLIPLEDKEVKLVPVEGGVKTDARSNAGAMSFDGSRQSVLGIATPGDREYARKVREMISGVDRPRPRAQTTPELRNAPEKNIFERGLDAFRRVLSPYDNKESMDPGEIASGQIAFEAGQRILPAHKLTINDQTVTVPERPMNTTEYKERVLPEGEGVRTAGRFLGGVPRGVKGVATGMLGVAQAFGSETAGKAADAIQADELSAPTDESLAGDVGAGFGSMLTFLVPGMGINKSMSMVSKVSGTAAKVGGASSMAALESATEAGNVFREMKQRGYSDEDASEAATKVFLANLPLNFLTDKAAFFPDHAADTAIKSGINSAVTEGLQEGAQEYISQRSQPDRKVDTGDIVRSSAIGAITGGGTGAALHGLSQYGMHAVQSEEGSRTETGSAMSGPLSRAVNPVHAPSTEDLNQEKTGQVFEQEVAPLPSGSDTGSHGYVAGEENETGVMEQLASMGHGEEPSAASLLKPAQREFIRDRVASLGNMDAVMERYVTESPVDRYAREVATDLFPGNGENSRQFDMNEVAPGQPLPRPEDAPFPLAANRMENEEPDIPEHIERAVAEPRKVSPQVSIATKVQTKNTLAEKFSVGEITPESPIRLTTVEELHDILKSGRLREGKDFEGRSGISAQLVDAKKPVIAYGPNDRISAAVIFPAESNIGRGEQPNEVKVDSATDVAKLRFVIDGHKGILTFEQLKEAIGGNGNAQEGAGDVFTGEGIGEVVPAPEMALPLAVSFDKGNISFRFAARPDEETTRRLTSMKFVPDPSGLVWAAKDTPFRRQFTKRLQAKYYSMDAAEEAPSPSFFDKVDRSEALTENQMYEFRASADTQEEAPSPEPSRKNDPAQVVQSLAAYTSPKEAVPTLVEVGRLIYRDGMKYREFAGKMKALLGDMWQKFKGMMLKVWLEVKRTFTEERGSVTISDGKRKGPDKHFEFSDDAVEEGIQRNRKGVRGESIFAQLLKAAQDFGHGFTRQFKPLPRDTFFAEANKVFSDLEASRGTASREARRKIIDVMGGMDAATADAFTKALVVNDAVETFEIVKERGETFRYPFGITEENVHELKEELDAALERLPQVREAVERYYQTTKELNKRYTEAAEALGVRGMEHKFKRDKYFHHMVMRYADAKKGTKGGGLKTQIFRNFMRKRHGSVEDINTNVVQATYKIWAQMEADIRRMELYKELQDTYDLMPKLRKQLRAMRQNIMRGLAARVGFMDEALPDKVKRLWEIGGKKGEILQKPDFRESEIIRLDNEFRRVSMEIQNGIDAYREKLLDPDFYDREYARFREEWEEKKEADFPEDVGDELFSMSVRRLTGFQLSLLNGDIKPFVKPLLRKAAGGRDYRLATVRDHFYRAKTIADDMVDEMMLDVAGQMIGKDDLKNILVKADPDVWVLPAEIVNTFDHIKDQAIAARTKGKRFIHVLGSGMKRYFLFAPHNVLRYISNNTVGDTSFLFGVAPKAAIGPYLKESVKILLKMKDLKPLNVGEQRQEDIAYFFRKGGEEVGITVQEIPRAQNHKMLKAFQQRGWLDRIADLPADYLDSVYAVNTFTETSRRLAAYLYFLEKWRNGEKAYGASRRELVDGLRKIEDKAYQVANDALVNYAQTSESGRNLADWFLFWSFREGNFRRWYNLFRNIPVDENRARAILTASGMLAGKSAAKLTGVALVRGAQITVMLGLLHAITTAYNWLFWPDEEDELAAEVRSKPHLIFGRSEDGKVLYWQGYDAMTEILSWVGMDQWVKHFKTLEEGNVKDVVWDVAYAPINQVYGLWNPLLGKYALESMLGKTGWPMLQEPRPIRDKAEYFANILGLVPEYRLVTGKPSEGYLLDRGKSLLVKRADTGQVAFYKTGEMVEDFLGSKNRGKTYSEPEGENAKRKRDALYNLKRAILYHDDEKVMKYTRLYREHGGTYQGLRQSVAMTHPLAAIPDYLKGEFMNSLNAEQKKTVDRAVNWYQTVYGGSVSSIGFTE